MREIKKEREERERTNFSHLSLIFLYTKLQSIHDRGHKSTYQHLLKFSFKLTLQHKQNDIQRPLYSFLKVLVSNQIIQWSLIIFHELATIFFCLFFLATNYILFVANILVAIDHNSRSGVLLWLLSQNLNHFLQWFFTIASSSKLNQFFHFKIFNEIDWS